MAKFLIVGLGNIGDEYANTRHNVGFLVADEFVRSFSGKFSTQRLADVAEVKFKGKIFVVIKPSTYMNLSGKAVNYWLQAEKISKASMLVVTDDIALPFGTLRLRGKGSDGGHNGLTSIQETLNSTEYARLRFGVGNEFSKGKQVDHVLGEWDKEEKAKLQERISMAADVIKSFGTIGLERTMTAYNKK